MISISILNNNGTETVSKNNGNNSNNNNFIKNNNGNIQAILLFQLEKKKDYSLLMISKT